MLFFKTLGLLFVVVGGVLSAAYLSSLVRKKIDAPQQPIWRLYFAPTLMLLIAASNLCRVVMDAGAVDRFNDGVWTLAFLGLAWGTGFASLRRLRIGQPEKS